jgi:predicted transposase YbfD/YdcC
MRCQHDITRKILDKNASSILVVKHNQKNLKQQIEKVFSIEELSHSHQLTDMGHGRVKKRECDVIGTLQFLNGRSSWPRVQGIVRIKSERAEKITRAMRYYIFSLNEDATPFNAKMRQHWASGNNVHW